jgi:hypothetical protein
MAGGRATAQLGVAVCFFSLSKAGAIAEQLNKEKNKESHTERKVESVWRDERERREE